MIFHIAVNEEIIHKGFNLDITFTKLYLTDESKMRLSPFASGKDPLSLVEKRTLDKALKEQNKIDGKVIRKILKSEDITFKEYSSLMEGAFEETIKSLDYAKRYISNLLKNPTIYFLTLSLCIIIRN